MFKIFSTYICWINIYKMQRLEVTGAVRLIYRSLGVKWLGEKTCKKETTFRTTSIQKDNIQKDVVKQDVKL